MDWTHLRKYPRVSVDLPAVYTLGGRSERTRILTLGGGGLFLGIPETLPLGAKLVVSFRPAKHFPPLELEAQVRHVIPGEGVGVDFPAITAEHQQKLMKLILHRIGDSRKSRRAPLAVQVEHEGGMLIGFSNNISVGGMFIETKEPVATESSIRLRFNLEDNGPIIIVDGEVRYSVEKTGMGVRFLNLTSDDENRINTYLAQGTT